jgi:hypothetical protein
MRVPLHGEWDADVCTCLTPLTFQYFDGDVGDCRKKKEDDPEGAAAGKKKKEKKTINGDIVRHVQQANSALYFQYNTQLGPPYQVLVDTNFINFSIQNKSVLALTLVSNILPRFRALPHTIAAYFTRLIATSGDNLGDAWRRGAGDNVGCVGGSGFN